MAGRRVSVVVDADVSPYNRGLLGAVATTKTFARELESADSRMANLVQSGLALAPALVPLGAAAIPAIAGLTTQLGFAAGAAGVTVLAFQGIGDALKSLNDYQVDPTSAHLEKLQQAMDALGPAGQEFVLTLQSLRPEMQKLQDIAQAGMLPGVADGINELMDLMPEATDLVETFSTTLGNLVREGADNLNDDRWVEFFRFLDEEAAGTLTAMGKSLGNVVEGLANMVMAFNPLADDFTTGLLDWSRAFKDWSAGLEGSEGLQNFIDYVREATPQALATMGALADTFVAFVKAAAPVGAIVLPGIEGLAKAFAAIADSSVGSALVAAAAAIGLMGRSMALWKTVGGSAIGTTFKNAAKPIGEASAAMDAYARNQNRATMSVKEFAKYEEKRSATLRAGAAQIGKAGALVGGFALLQSGLAEKTGLSNSASLALMGTLAGPFGAALGAGVGFTMDLAHANDDLQDSLERVARSAGSLDFSQQSADLAGLRADVAATSEAIQNPFSNGVGGLMKAGYNLIPWVDDIDDARDKLHETNVDLAATKQGIAEFFAAMNDGDLSMLYATDEELSKYVHDIAPAVQAAGLDIRDVLTTHSGWNEAQAAVREYVAAMDSAHGRSKLVADAMDELATSIAPNVTQAEALKNALDALFGPELNQSAATDAWTQSLKDLNKGLIENGTALNGNSDAAHANRERIRGSIQALSDKVAADAAAGVSGDKLAMTMLNGRDKIIEQAKAAGANADAIKGMVNEMGLTPESIATVIMQPGMLDAKQQVKALGRLYDLTPKEVRTILAAIDKGMSPTKALKSVYDKLDGRQIKTLVQALTGQAESAVARFSAAFNGLDGRVARTFIETTTTHIDRRLTATNRATGGHVTGPGTATSDSIPAYLSNGEYVVRAAAVEKYGTHMFDNLNAMRLASGGPVQRFANGGFNFDPRSYAPTASGPVRSLDDRLAIAQVLQQIRDLKKSLNADGKKAIHGLDRRIAALQLEAAQHELRAAKHKEEREAKAAIRDTRSTVRGLFDSLDTSWAPEGHQSQMPATSAAIAQMMDLRKSIRDAGGEWTRGMQKWSDGLIRLAGRTDRLNDKIATETAKRDALVEKLSDQQQALDQLQQTMQSYSDSVAGKFLTDPFGGAHTVTTPGQVDPTLAANLSAAEQQLIAIRNSASGDSVASAAAASALIPQIAAMRAEVEKQSQPVETMVSGLQAMRDELQKSTADALAMADALKTLAAKGLDTSGPLGGLYASLAASGDFATAEELAALSADQIDEYEKLFATREDAAAAVGALATQAVYGKQQVLLLGSIDKTTAQLAHVETALAAFTEQAKVVGDQVRIGAHDGTALALQPLTARLDAMEKAVANQARQNAEHRKKVKP